MPKILHIQNWVNDLQCVSITDKNAHGFATTAHLNVATTTKLPIIASHWAMLSHQNVIFLLQFQRYSGPSDQFILFDPLSPLVDLLVFLKLLDFEEILSPLYLLGKNNNCGSVVGYEVVYIPRVL